MASQEFYHSVDGEFESLYRRLGYLIQNQVRPSGIGEVNWYEEGEWVEQIVRTVLRRHLPGTVEVTSGFVIDKSSSVGEDAPRVSNQIDVLIISREAPILFRNDNLVVVTPDAVQAMIEFKRIKNRPGQKVIKKLKANLGWVRKRNPNCRAGLFCVNSPMADEKEKTTNGEQEEKWYSGEKARENLLNSLCEVIDPQQQAQPIVDFLALGGDYICRYFHQGEKKFHKPESGKAGGYEEVKDPGWHLYRIEEMAFGYFLANVVDWVSPDSVKKHPKDWFPDSKGRGFGVEIGKCVYI